MTVRGFGCNISTQQLYDISQTRCCSLLQKMGFKRIKSSRSDLDISLTSSSWSQYIEQFILYPLVLLEEHQRCRGLNINTGFSCSHPATIRLHQTPPTERSGFSEGRHNIEQGWLLSQIYIYRALAMINGIVIMTSVASVKDRWNSFSSTIEAGFCF